MKPDLFHGHEQRDCGEHRTCGTRAWCFDCSEWCSDYAPCKGCEMPKLRAEVEKLTAEVNSGVCEPCSMNDYPDYSVTWPCDTIRALDGGGT